MRSMPSSEGPLRILLTCINAQTLKTGGRTPHRLAPNAPLATPSPPMTFDQATAFFLFSVVAAITPGPSNTMIVATGSAWGLWRGLPCALGSAVGMGMLLFASALGLGQ